MITLSKIRSYDMVCEYKEDRKQAAYNDQKQQTAALVY
jgi:hypothetical protein